MIDKMTKYSFILLSSGSEDFLKKLQELGVVDITRSRRPVDAQSSAMLDNASELKRITGKLESVDYSGDSGYDDILKAAAAASGKLPLSGENSDAIAARAVGTFQEIERKEAQYAAMLKEIARRRPWGEFKAEDIAKLDEDGYSLHWYYMSVKNFRKEWEEEYPLSVINDDGAGIWFVTVSGKDDTYDFPAEEVQAPAADWKEAEKEASDIRSEIVRLKGTVLCLKEKVSELKRAYSEKVEALDLYLAGTSASLAADDRITVFTGFAPEENEKELCAVFDTMDIAYVKEKAVEEDNPPIRLKNNRFARMFEVLTGMYGMPVYSEFDPTPILGPFFLLFFAMCMGDAGYGILLILIGILLGKGSGSMSKLGPLVTTLGAGTLVVGIVLGTFFGINLAEAAWVPGWLKKCMITGEVAGYSAQMVMALIIGVFHICLAMTIKAVGYTRRFGFRNTVSTWGWLLLILGGISIAAMSTVGVLSETAMKWAVIAVGSVSALGIYIFNTPGRNPLVNIGSGLWDTYNMATGLLGDVLSYLRLYALGLAGGMLGNAFNNLAGMLKDGIPVPGLDWVAFLLILVLGHALNLAMSCLGAFVHPLRLTFVEYFKNSGYEGKGTAYNPLTKTQDNAA